jgi:hypothetical protein
MDGFFVKEMKQLSKLGNQLRELFVEKRWLITSVCNVKVMTRKRSRICHLLSAKFKY